jgi:hypothetical protein
MLIFFYQTTWCHNPEDYNMNLHHREILKSKEWFNFNYQVPHIKNENTPPHSRKTPRHKVAQNEGIRSPLHDSRISMKHSGIKKKLFSACLPKISSSSHLDGPKFQTLAPQTPNGPSFVRVQNSQVKLIFKYSCHRPWV